MDVVYCVCHSRHADLELRYSLRSVAKFFPDVGKVWIFGDKPTYLSDDKQIVEHLSHDQIASTIGMRTPITSYFQMLFASSLIPDLTNEYLWFCDDYVLLEPLTLESARKLRYLEQLSSVKRRGRGPWHDALWRTYEILVRLGYPTLNFETHIPTFCRRRWAFDAYRDLQDFVTRDRWLGMLGPTAILNHAVKSHAESSTPLALVDVVNERSRIGFWGEPPSYAQLQQQCEGRRFLNFDDRAWCEDLLRFLNDIFPDPCRYENAITSG